MKAAKRLERDRFIKRLYEDGVSGPQIAQTFMISNGAVIYALKQQGVTMRPRGSYAREKAAPRHSVGHAYSTSHCAAVGMEIMGWKQSEIVTVLRVSRQLVSHWLGEKRGGDKGTKE